ncbi:MAG: hypothetical protein SGARI_006830 [Bacillariaceae sp.]
MCIDYSTISGVEKGPRIYTLNYDPNGVVAYATCSGGSGGLCEFTGPPTPRPTRSPTRFPTQAPTLSEEQVVELWEKLGNCEAAKDLAECFNVGYCEAFPQPSWNDPQMTVGRLLF